MRKLICTLLIFLPLIGFAQLPDKVKHVEIASEVVDTMILINKPDLDKINTAFYRLDVADSLNVINDRLIEDLTITNTKLKDVIEEQGIIIDNKDIIIDRIKTENQDLVSDLEKQIKRANRRIIFWQTTTGIGAIAAIFLAIF